MKVNYNDLPSVKRSLKQSIDSLYYFDESLINNTFLKDSIIFRIALFLADSYEEVMSEDDVKLKVDCSIKNSIMIHERDNDDHNIIYLKVCNNENVESVKKEIVQVVEKYNFLYGVCFNINDTYRNSRFEMYYDNSWNNLY